MPLDCYSSLAIFLDPISHGELAIAKHLCHQSAAMNKASERTRMSQSHEMSARLAQSQAAQAYRAHLELTSHEVIQAHPLG